MLASSIIGMHAAGFPVALAADLLFREALGAGIQFVRNETWAGSRSRRMDSGVIPANAAAVLIAFSS